MTQSLKKFPGLEFKMFKEGLFIPEMSKPLPIKKYCNQWRKCLRKDNPFSGCFTYLVIFGEYLQTETTSYLLCGYLLVAWRLLVARSSAHSGEACEMRFSSAQLQSASRLPKNARKGIWSLCGRHNADLNSASSSNPSYVKSEQIMSSLGTYKQVDVLESFGVCHIRVFLRSLEP